MKHLMSEPIRYGVMRTIVAAILLCVSMMGSAVASPQDSVVAALTKQADAWDKGIVHKDRKPFTSHYRYIDIYARRNGRWQIVSVRITRLAS